MLADAGADVSVEPWGEGRVVTVRASALRPVDRVVPGDPSQSAFFVVAGSVVAGQRGRGDRRLQRPGAAWATCRSSSAWARGSPSYPTHPAPPPFGRPPGLCAATQVQASEIPSLDEVPALAVAAAVAEGTTVFSDVGELRVKEVDRLAAVASLVEAFGASARVEGDTSRHHRCGRAAARRSRRQPGRPPHGHGRRGGGVGRPARRAQPDHRVRRGRHQLPGLRGGPRTARGRSGAARRAPAAARRHRRPGRRRQVDRVARGGRAPRCRTARYGSDVPGGSRPGARPRHRTRRRGGGGRAGRGGADRGRTAGAHRRRGRDGRHPLARGRPRRLHRGGQPRGPAPAGACASGPGPRRTAGVWSRGATSGRSCSPTPS